MVQLGKLRAVFDPVVEALPTIDVSAVVGVGACWVDQGRIGFCATANGTYPRREPD